MGGGTGDRAWRALGVGMVNPRDFADPMLYLTARPVVLSDESWLFRLRNDPVTIAASIVAQPVTEAEHRRWLATTLVDPTRALMIVGEIDVAIATYRLDGLGASMVEVSLTVAPEARGRGLAVPVIRLAAEHAMREGADLVLALVRRENVPSRRAFERAGFSPEAMAPSYVIRTISVAGWRCAACARDVPHHTNSLTSIGRPGLRYPIYDLHEEPDGFYGFLTYECNAGDLWLAWDRARRRRLGEPEPDYSVRSTMLAEEGR